MARPVVHIHFWFWLLMASMDVSWACRYSVRDTGFVDFGHSSWRLELSAISSFPTQIQDSLSRAVKQVSSDCTLEFQSKVEAAPGAAPVLLLLDGEGRSLKVASGDELPHDDASALHLVESVFQSPMREQILAEALRAYAVVLLVEGSDTAANERARDAVKSAIANVTRLMPGMPKPVKVPPQLVALPLTVQMRESVLLWSLGWDPQPTTDPRVAIVYGRGRRLGTSLEGPLITQTVLRERLVLVGQDCECDLDRAWLRGPLMAARWDRGMQDAAAKSLGFDPENPLIRAEVSRIVERGPQPGQRRKTAGTSNALGYSEDSVDSLPAPADLVERTETPSASDAETPRPAGQAVPEANAGSGAASALWWVFGGGLGISVVVASWIALRSPR